MASVNYEQLYNELSFELQYNMYQIDLLVATDYQFYMHYSLWAGVNWCKLDVKIKLSIYELRSSPRLAYSYYRSRSVYFTK